MILVIATLTVKSGALPALVAAAKPCIEATRQEEGCLLYDLHSSLTDPHKLVFVEKWETREALTAHSRTAHLAAWREASAPHISSRVIEVVHPERIETF